MEGYTSSITYPYASRLPDGNPTRYIRNSVKAVVDAYNGKIRLYVSEPKDPIIIGWTRIFPDLFKPISLMPKSIKDHLRKIFQINPKIKDLRKRF